MDAVMITVAFALLVVWLVRCWSTPAGTKVPESAEVAARRLGDRSDASEGVDAILAPYEKEFSR